MGQDTLYTAPHSRSKKRFNVFSCRSLTILCSMLNNSLFNSPLRLFILLYLLIADTLYTAPIPLHLLQRWFACRTNSVSSSYTVFHVFQIVTHVFGTLWSCKVFFWSILTIHTCQADQLNQYHMQNNTHAHALHNTFHR